MLLDEIGCEPNEIDSIWADATLEEIELNETNETNETNGRIIEKCN